MTFSVVIPVHNRTCTLKSALESVLCQTFKGYEIIIIDDGSDDSVKRSLKPYMSLIRYIRLDKNSGVSTARNTGIREANGEYIAFLDSDDLWLPKKLELQKQALSETGTQVCHTNEFWYRRDRFINQKRKHQRYSGYIFDKVLDLCRISPSSVVIHRDVFRKSGLFDEYMRTCEDYDLWLRICAYFEISYLADKLIIKRAVTDDQLSASIKHIEYIRLVSLAKTLMCRNLTYSQKLAAVTEIKRKTAIAAGALNRN